MGLSFELRQSNEFQYFNHTASEFSMAKQLALKNSSFLPLNPLHYSFET